MKKLKRSEYDFMGMTPAEIITVLDNIDAELTGSGMEDWASETGYKRRCAALGYIYRLKMMDRRAFNRCHKIIKSEEYGNLDEADEDLELSTGRIQSIWNNEV